MRKFLVILMMLLAIGCTKEIDFTTEVTSVLGTRAEEPLNNTIWEYTTGDVYNIYLYFHGDKASLFYGYEEAGELQRWSDFYTSDFSLIGNKIETSISYPNYGKTEHTENLQLFIINNTCEMVSNGRVFKYTTYSPRDIEGMWMIITVNIQPWK